MLTSYAINHEGRSFSPDGAIPREEDATCTCGARVDTSGFSYPIYNGAPICENCAAVLDSAELFQANIAYLYLHDNTDNYIAPDSSGIRRIRYGRQYRAEMRNASGGIAIPCSVSVCRGNIARVMFRVRFRAAGKTWTGQVGENSQLVRCRAKARK